MSKDNFARQDSELFQILKQANKNELEILAEIISDKVSSKIDKKEINPLKIAVELQSMGGDTFVNLFRNNGVKYREIAEDVGEKVDIKHIKNLKILQLEEAISEKLIEKYKESLSTIERNKFEDELKQEAMKQASSANAVKRSAKQAVVGIAPVLSMISLFIARRGAAAALATIPGIGQVFAAIASVIGAFFMFSGPAYSVTVPAVMVIGSIRARLETEKREQELEF